MIKVLLTVLFIICVGEFANTHGEGEEFYWALIAGGYTVMAVVFYIILLKSN